MLGDELAAFLAGSPRGGDAQVVAWRFEQSVADTVRVATRDGRLGGPYAAPTIATRLGGSLELRWSDEYVTRATIGGEALADLAAQVVAWRAEASPTRLVGTVAPPSACPDVATADRAVTELVSNDPAALLDLHSMAARRLAESDLERSDVTVAASAGARRVVTSAGFDEAWDETSVSVEAGADDVHDETIGMRRFPSAPELVRLVDDVAETARRLRETDDLADAPRGVLFAPSVTDALLARFLVSNLDGRAVLGKHGRFTETDFAGGRLILGTRLSVVVDTTLPFLLATAPCSSEGVPGGRVTLVRDGRLVTPMLDREHAARMGRAPTPVPRGRPALLLDSSDAWLDVADALATVGQGAIVRALLGLHTVRARTGDYSVVAPHAQAVHAGRAGGHVALRVRGNLFEQLCAPETRLVRFPGWVTPGLLVLGPVAMDEA